MELSSVTVRVLGAVDMVDGSGEVRDVPGRRMQTLLARLVSQSGQTVSADALVDAVWPDGLPESPDAALQTQVFRLRKRLAPYVAAGCRTFDLLACAAHLDTAVAGVSEIRRLLTNRV